jgi:hypothetical protein
LNALTAKFKEVLYSVLPITAIVLLLNFTIAPIGTTLTLRFLVGVVLIIIGLAVFLLGVDLGITPIGNQLGGFLAKSNKLGVILVVGAISGFFISVAEPDLHILAGQVDTVTAGQITKWGMVIAVSVGIGVMMSLGIFRVVRSIRFRYYFAGVYFVIFILSLFSSADYLAIAFDASGATTGALTVPFMLALTMGVAVLKKDSVQSEEDSFGLVGIASTGAILAMLLMGLFTDGKGMTGSLEIIEDINGSVLRAFFETAPRVAIEVVFALAPIVIIFVVLQLGANKVSRKQVRRIIIGILFVWFGLVLFLTGVNAGFMDVGSKLGAIVASHDNKLYAVIVAFILGLVTILAEPAVSVLTHQIEDVTSGSVRRRIVLLTLSIGVGIAVMIAMIRILVPSIQLWHYILPGFALSVIMSFFVPDLFVGMSFDSGGVASGPMTATFILAFFQGAAQAVPGANVIEDGFGMISVVAMTPIIALQILGLIYKIKLRKEGVNKDGQPG